MTHGRTTFLSAVAVIFTTAGPSSSYVAVVETRPPVAHPASTRRWTSLGVGSFDRPLFPKDGDGGARRSVPSTKAGVDIVVPDFDVMFSRVAEVSPLAKQVLERCPALGFDAIEEGDDTFKWKTLESHNDKDRFLIHRIDKIDEFQGIHAPLLRFRSRMRGPAQSRGERFSHLLTEFEARTKWDPNLAEIYEMYPVRDMGYADAVMDHRFGEAVRFGAGYVRTKKNVVSPREQFTLCGVQDFVELGSSIVWGVEMESDQDHLMPGDKRLLRSRTHLFSTTLVPAGKDVFDCEYVIQLEVGKFPVWLAGPILAELIKGLFRHAEKYFEGGLGDGELAKFLEEERKKHSDMIDDRHSMLITP